MSKKSKRFVPIIEDMNMVLLNQSFEYFDRAEINKNVTPLWNYLNRKKKLFAKDTVIGGSCLVLSLILAGDKIQFIEELK